MTHLSNYFWKQILGTRKSTSSTEKNLKWINGNEEDIFTSIDK